MQLSRRWALFFTAFALGFALLLAAPGGLGKLVFGPLLLLLLGALAWLWLRPLLPPIVKALQRVPVRVWALAALLAFAESAIAFQSRPPFAGAIGWLLLAAGCAWSALWLQKSPPPGALEPTPAPPLLPPLALRPRWLPLLLGVGGMLLTAEINGVATFFLPPVHANLQFALLCASFALLVWGLSGKTSRVPLPAQETTPRAVWGALLAITLLALLLRASAPGETIRTLVDEIHFMVGILDLRFEPEIRLLSPMSDISPFTWLYPYWQAGLVAVFGHDLTGFRLVSAFLGTANVLALYALTEALFGRKTALLAALLLAVFPPHVHYSRLALIQIADPLAGTLLLAFFARGLRSGKNGEFALAGLALGLTQYFYEAGRLFFPALLAFWSLGLLVTRRKLPWRGLLITLFAGALVAFPIYYTLFVQKLPLTGRYDASGVGASYWEQLFDALITGGDIGYHIARTITPLLVYINRADPSLYYAGRTALILPLLLPFFLAGVAWALWRWRQAGALLLIGWVLGTSAGNSLLVEYAVSSRYTVVFPALALLLAAGVIFALDTAALWLKPARMRLLTPLLIGGLCLLQVWYYFGPHLALYQVQSRPAADAHDAVLRSLNFPPGTNIHIIGNVAAFTDDYLRDFLWFLSDGRDLALFALYPEEVTAVYLQNLPRRVDHAFFVQPDDTATLNRIVQVFALSSAQLTPYRATPLDRAYVLYYVPAATGD
ncbi:MAG: glycosyltransferase family 39 protein [Chloroflexi bacterium]|nr:glycosyltransferase family 39 protein [Chloroflexota bacterium]